MAMPPCSQCNNESGVLMITDLIDGDTQVIGGTCLTGYILAFAAGLLASMEPIVQEAYAEILDQIKAADQRPTVQPSPVSSGAKKRAAPKHTATTASVDTAPVGVTQDGVKSTEQEDLEHQETSQATDDVTPVTPDDATA